MALTQDYWFREKNALKSPGALLFKRGLCSILDHLENDRYGCFTRCHFARMSNWPKKRRKKKKKRLIPGFAKP